MFASRQRHVFHHFTPCHHAAAIRGETKAVGFAGLAFVAYDGLGGSGAPC